MSNIAQFLRVAAPALVLASLAYPAGASSVEPSRISLPKGPASVEGLGRNFVPSLASGTAAYGLEIALPPGVAGFVPKLAFEYDSGGGVSELGMGWRLGAGRRTVSRVSTRPTRSRSPDLACSVICWRSRRGSFGRSSRTGRSCA